ncbi:MAG: hypothetical protein LVR00_07235 [Rhabdochlamydiaceae bacterium]|jgi:hypothetical protein
MITGILTAAPLLSSVRLPTFPQATLAGTAAVLTFLFFDHIYGCTPSPAGRFLIDIGAHATIWTGVITTLTATQKRWPMLSLIGGTTSLGLSTLTALAPYVYRLSKEDGESLIVSALSIIGITINVIATSYLLYKQPSVARALHWAAVTLSIAYCSVNAEP